MITILIAIYLLGCILAYGRQYALYCDIDFEFIRFDPPSITKSEIFGMIVMSLFSWLCVISLFIIIPTSSSKYLFKYSNKDLIRLHNQIKDVRKKKLRGD